MSNNKYVQLRLEVWKFLEGEDNIVLLLWLLLRVHDWFCAVISGRHLLTFAEEYVWKCFQCKLAWFSTRNMKVHFVPKYTDLLHVNWPFMLTMFLGKWVIFEIWWYPSVYTRESIIINSTEMQTCYYNVIIMQYSYIWTNITKEAMLQWLI